VDEPVMAAAQQEKVVRARLATPRPVSDVVGVDEALVVAAREAAAPVAGLERPP
jgi:hypothetical protein